MTVSHQQYLDRLADIGKHYGKDECLPECSRQLFSRASEMADVFTRGSEQRNCNPVEDTFAVLCEACKAAGLRQCKERHNAFLACQLVWDFSA